MYTSCIHGRDPRRLSNSAKWPMPTAFYIVCSQRQNVRGESQLWEGTRKSTVRLQYRFKSLPSSLVKSFQRFRVTFLFPVQRGRHLQKWRLLYKCKGLLQKSNFYYSLSELFLCPLFLKKYSAQNNPYTKEAYFRLKYSSPFQYEFYDFACFIRLFSKFSTMKIHYY